MRSWIAGSLTLSLVLAPGVGRASEQIPDGAAIIVPPEGGHVQIAGPTVEAIKAAGGKILYLKSDTPGTPSWLFTRKEVEDIVVLDRDLGTCREHLADCEGRLVKTLPIEPPKRPVVRGLVVGGFVVSVSAAFVAGVLVATQAGR